MYKSFTEYLDNSVTLEMVAISGGIFLMGSPEGEGEDEEKPQHEVTVQCFYIGKYPVTQAQWKEVAALPKVDRDLEGDLLGFDPSVSCFKGANMPVICISWLEAKEFCSRLSKSTGKIYRLPSEAEWEYACRAETTTPYYFGNTINNNLVNCNYEYGEITEVEKFPPNAFGLYDMHGNVWEWCEDSSHENYINAPIDGSAWIDTNTECQIMRGGSWFHHPSYCRSASRYCNGDLEGRNHTNFYIGFRVVCEIE